MCVSSSAPNVADVHIFFAQLFGELVDRLVAALADGFVHLHLQDQVAAALKIQTQLDAVGEILLHLRQRRGKSECRSGRKCIAE